jgi:hypothetical protein
LPVVLADAAPRQPLSAGQVTTSACAGTFRTSAPFGTLPPNGFRSCVLVGAGLRRSTECLTVVVGFAPFFVAFFVTVLLWKR